MMTRAMPTVSLSSKQKKWKRLLEKLEMRCLQPIEELCKLGTVKKTKDGPLVHIDRGSKILGVAHMDTVARKWPTSVNWVNGGKHKLPCINSIQLDDRLGVWVLLDLLPAMGMEFDVLLCDSEERGASTAEHFLSEREYNWGFEFDRAGMDTVLYSYEDDGTWTDALKHHGFDIQFGSFSDISSLTHLGCCFANFGVGYQKQHTDACHAFLDDTVLMAIEFESWFKEQKDTRYSYTHQDKWSYRSYGWYGRSSYTSSGKWQWKDSKVSTVSKTSDPKPDHYGRIWAKCYHCGKQFYYLPEQGTLWSCPYCTKTVDVARKEEQMPRCKSCGAREWDDYGCCEICGYDMEMNEIQMDDVSEDCPWCGRDQWWDDNGVKTCDNCGYVGEIR
jgi:hypothetical protein